MQKAPVSTAELDDFITRPHQGVVDAVADCSGRIAVLGAGGKMGFHFCRMLQRALLKLNRHDPILAVSRFGTQQKRQEFESSGFEVVAADLTDAVQVAALPPIENVFFLAGLKFGTSGEADLLTRFNVDMPRLIAQHFHRSRIVALSTGCVYSFTIPESGGATEQGETEPPGNYANSCKGRERAFVEAASQLGTRSALIRLNYSIDLRYGVLLDLARTVMNGDPVNVNMGYVNVIWQGDAVAHAIQCLPHADTPPFVINVTGPRVLRIRDVAEMFGKRIGRDVRFEGEERPTAWLSNASRSHTLFGPPAIDLEQMVAWTTDWLQRGGDTLNKPTHFEVRDGNY